MQVSKVTCGKLHILDSAMQIEDDLMPLNERISMPDVLGAFQTPLQALKDYTLL